MYCRQCRPDLTFQNDLSVVFVAISQASEPWVMSRDGVSYLLPSGTCLSLRSHMGLGIAAAPPPPPLRVCLKKKNIFYFIVLPCLSPYQSFGIKIDHNVDFHLPKCGFFYQMVFHVDIAAAGVP